MKTAVIAGCTGLIGSQLLTLLLESNSYEKVIAVGRRKVDISHPKLDQHKVDFNNLEIEVNEIDDVFCCLGTTMKTAGSKEKFRLVDFQYPVNLAASCLTKGAKHFSLVSSMGADENSKIFYNKVKGEVENAVGQLGYESVAIFRPSMLLGNRTESRVGEYIGKIIMKLFGFVLTGPLKNYKAIDSSKVARAMVLIAQEKSNRTSIHLSGELQSY